MPKSSAFHNTATALTLGTASLRSASRLADSSVAISDTPVMLLPGWARLAARPVATGSPELITTIGILPPRSFAAAAMLILDPERARPHCRVRLVPADLEDASRITQG